MAEVQYSGPPRRGGPLYCTNEGQSPEYESAIKSIGTPNVWPPEGAKVCMEPNKILKFIGVVGYQMIGIDEIYKFSS